MHLAVFVKRSLCDRASGRAATPGAGAFPLFRAACTFPSARFSAIPRRPRAFIR